MRTILFALSICLLLTACTVGVVKRQEPAPTTETPSVSSESTPLPTATEPEPTPLARGPAWQVTIDTPEDNAVLDVTKPIYVSGTGRGLFEGNVVVQALDSQGNLLAEAPTTVHSAEFGDEGDWQVELSLAVEPGTSGQLVAFATALQYNQNFGPAAEALKGLE